MSDAPERVWVETNEYDSDMGPYMCAYPWEWEGVEYIRADIHQRDVDNLRYSLNGFQEMRREVARLRGGLEEITSQTWTTAWSARRTLLSCQRIAADALEGDNE